MASPGKKGAGRPARNGRNARLTRPPAGVGKINPQDLREIKRLVERLGPRVLLELIDLVAH